MDRRGYLRGAGLVGTIGLSTALAGCSALGGTDQGGTEEDTPSPNGSTQTETDRDSPDRVRSDYGTVRVPDEEPTVQDGVDAAAEGDLILVSSGTYAENVEITTPGLTLRGLDRNGVVLDGEFGSGDGVHVEADGVAIENLTIRHFEANAIYWSGVEGFRASFVTAYNNGYYGIYAYDATDGRFECSYASGHPDAGFYLGWNQPFRGLVTNCIAEYNALGYSGTSTGEGIEIRDSVWRHNMAGIAPNTLSEDSPHERASTIVGNVVYDNGYEDAPTIEYPYGMFGTGIVVWGGHENLIENNVVAGHPNYGIAIHPSVNEPEGNVVRGNLVRDSGEADLALGAPAGIDNEYTGNQFATSAPSGLQADASTGSDAVTALYEDQAEQAADAADAAEGAWQDQPVPGAQPTMRDPEAPPVRTNKDTSVVE